MGTELLDALAGVADADMVVTNGRVVDVHKKEVRDGGIAVKAGRIIRVGEVESLVGPGTEVLDARGRYLTPGLIEAHAHSYHANMNLTEYGKLCLSRGTTAVAESFYGQGQIRGKEAVRFFYEELRRTPITLLFVVPVLAYLQNLELGLEATPGTLTGDDLFEMLEWEGCVGLEEPPYIPVAERDPVILALIEKALSQGKVVMGHAAGLTEEELDGYAAFGITGDHEQLTAEEAIWRVERGMMVGDARNADRPQPARRAAGADRARRRPGDVHVLLRRAGRGHLRDRRPHRRVHPDRGRGRDRSARRGRDRLLQHGALLPGRPHGRQPGAGPAGRHPDGRRPGEVRRADGDRQGDRGRLRRRAQAPASSGRCTRRSCRGRSG